MPCAVGLAFLALMALILVHCLIARWWPQTSVPSGPVREAKAVAVPLASQLQRNTPVLVLQPGPGDEVHKALCSGALISWSWHQALCIASSCQLHDACLLCPVHISAVSHLKCACLMQIMFGRKEAQPDPAGPPDCIVMVRADTAGATAGHPQES